MILWSIFIFKCHSEPLIICGFQSVCASVLCACACLHVCARACACLFRCVLFWYVSTCVRSWSTTWPMQPWKQALKREIMFLTCTMWSIVIIVIWHCLEKCLSIKNHSTESRYFGIILLLESYTKFCQIWSIWAVQFFGLPCIFRRNFECVIKTVISLFKDLISVQDPHGVLECAILL